MNPLPVFTGFPRKSLAFFKDLSENNDKRWFDEQRTDYEHDVLGPARDIIMALGDRLQTIAPGIQADPRVNKTGKVLAQALSKITGRGSYQLGGKLYKKIPSGYDDRHPQAEFLLYNEIHASVDFEFFPEVFSAGLIGFCFHHFQNMLPLHRWLLALTQRV